VIENWERKVQIREKKHFDIYKRQGSHLPYKGQVLSYRKAVYLGGEGGKNTEK